MNKIVKVIVWSVAAFFGVSAQATLIDFDGATCAPGCNWTRTPQSMSVDGYLFTPYPTSSTSWYQTTPAVLVTTQDNIAFNDTNVLFATNQPLVRMRADAPMLYNQVTNFDLESLDFGMGDLSFNPWSSTLEINGYRIGEGLVASVTITIPSFNYSYDHFVLDDLSNVVGSFTNLTEVTFKGGFEFDLDNIVATSYIYNYELPPPPPCTDCNQPPSFDTPEPNTLLLTWLAIAGLGVARRRQQ